MENTTAEDWAADVDELTDLIIATEDMPAFLDGLACLAAKVVSHSAGARVECAVTLGRRKRSGIIGGSNDTAIDLKRAEQALGEGPGLDAVARDRPVLLDDALTSHQCDDYCSALNEAGMSSSLAVPLNLDEDSVAALNYFAPATALFSREVIAETVKFSRLASKALRVALRITGLRELTEDLDAALKTRSVINTACGVIIAQNGCTQEEAIAILRKASSDRN